MFHQETDGVAAASATKALVDFLGRGYGEGGRFLIMERAKAEVIRPAFFEFDELPHDFDDVDSVLDLLYGMLADQWVQERVFGLPFRACKYTN